MTLGRPNIKTLCYRYRDSHYKDKTVSWPWHSYLCNGNPNARKGRLYTEIGPLLRHAYSISYNMCGRFCFVLFCLAVVISSSRPTEFQWCIRRGSSGLIQRHYGNRMVVPMTVKYLWRNWIWSVSKDPPPPPPPPPPTPPPPTTPTHPHHPHPPTPTTHTPPPPTPTPTHTPPPPPHPPHPTPPTKKNECEVRQKLVSMARTSNYTPQILCNLVTCPCPLYLFLAHKLHVSYHICVLRICFVHKLIT